MTSLKQNKIKILFPFVGKYPKLSNFWWHRLIVVLFIGSLIVSPFFIWYQGVASSPQANCVDNVTRRNEISGEYNLGDYDTCYKSGLYVGTNGVIGYVTTLFFSYLLQVLYYKIILHIVFGKKLVNLK